MENSIPIGSACEEGQLHRMRAAGRPKSVRSQKVPA